MGGKVSGFSIKLSSSKLLSEIDQVDQIDANADILGEIDINPTTVDEVLKEDDISAKE